MDWPGTTTGPDPAPDPGAGPDPGATTDPGADDTAADPSAGQGDGDAGDGDDDTAGDGGSATGAGDDGVSASGGSAGPDADRDDALVGHGVIARPDVSPSPGALAGATGDFAAPSPSPSSSGGDTTSVAGAGSDRAAADAGAGPGGGSGGGSGGGGTGAAGGGDAATDAPAEGGLLPAGLASFLRNPAAAAAAAIAAAGEAIAETIETAALVGDVAVENAPFPVALLAVLVCFLLLQHQIDRRDPKLANAPLHADPDLPFAAVETSGGHPRAPGIPDDEHPSRATS